MTDISERIAQIAALAGEAIALRQHHQTMTYAGLDDAASRLASFFCRQGVLPGSAIAIGLDRSPDWIVTALAILRAGCAYVPLDPAWPDERMRFVLADSGARLLVAPQDLLERLASPVIGVDPRRDAAQIAAQVAAAPADAAAPPRPKLAPESLAYIIYTSGSTGVPKGVEITHANLDHLIEWHREAFAVTPADRASHLAGLGFDAAVWEIWPTLASGATLTLVSDDLVRTSPELLLRWLVAEQVTLAFVPTPLAASMFALPWPPETAVRLLLTGGDTLQRAPPPGLPFAVVNNYGPTECTVVATSGVVQPGVAAAPPIGWPIRNTSVYLLDELGAPAPPGQPGELYIGGTSVARGYRNLLELTAQSFLPDPFAASPGARMYRTGDWGILLPDGQIAFQGRIDSQEKIRGQRVELGEIASVLHRHPQVAFAVVVTLVTATGDKQLIAHVLPAEGADPSSTELQHFLAESLPAPMIPTAFIRLRSLPLTPSGKVDRAILEAPSATNALSAAKPEPLADAPLTPIQEKLLGIAQELLGTSGLRIDQDFFLVGGHSLLGTQLVLRVREMFGVELNLRHLFEAGTIERLAYTVEEMLIAQLDDISDEEALLQVQQ